MLVGDYFLSWQESDVSWYAAKEHTLDICWSVRDEPNRGLQWSTENNQGKHDNLQRLITAYEAGRQVKLSMFLKRELMLVPSAVAVKKLQSAFRAMAILSQVLAHDLPCPQSPDATDPGESATLVVDGQELVFAIGSLSKQLRLEFGWHYYLLQAGRALKRIDIVFDRHCYETPIKRGTRKKQDKGSQPIRRVLRVIENRHMPLPTNAKPSCPIQTTKFTLPYSCPRNSNCRH